MATHNTKGFKKVVFFLLIKSEKDWFKCQYEISFFSSNCCPNQFCSKCKYAHTSFKANSRQWRTLLPTRTKAQHCLRLPVVAEQRGLIPVTGFNQPHWKKKIIRYMGFILSVSSGLQSIMHTSCMQNLFWLLVNLLMKHLQATPLLHHPYFFGLAKDQTKYLQKTLKTLFSTRKLQE